MVTPAPIGFERSSVSGAGVDELDWEALSRYLHQRAPALAESLGIEGLAQRIGLVARISGGSLAPSIAGLYAFGSCPQLLRPEWGVSALRITGSAITDPIVARADLEGGLAALLDQSLGFVRAHSPALPDLLRPEHKHRAFPELAVREAIANALIHRDLRLPGRVGLRIYDDHLEISSPGGPATPLALDDLAQRGGLSLPRNPLLAAVARGLGLIEQVGCGLARIRGEHARGEPPSFQTSHHEVLVSLPSLLRGGDRGAPAGAPRSANAN